MSNSVFRSGLVAVVAILYLAVFFYLNRWPTTLYHGDSSHYYLHVVSFFVNQDVGDYSESISALLEASPGTADPREDMFGVRLTEKGRRYIKYTLGVPLFEAPFFILAHTFASLSEKYLANGWSEPYTLLVGLAPIFYICFGFWLLSGVLLRYFTRNATTLTVLAIAVATNLLYQGTYVVMAHAFLFFAHCLLIYLSIRFYEKPNWRRALSIGLAIGLIAITRVPEVICAVVPLLWGVRSTGTLRERIKFFGKAPSFLLIWAVGVLAVFSIQMAYWYYVSGKLIFDPYQGEGIDLLDPKLHKGWFDFSNGWLIYTPIMAFSLAGLFFLRGKSREALLPILAFVLPHAYIHYSYYAWTYFPGLGQRPMVETYPLLSISLAAFFALCLKSRWIRWVPAALVVSFGLLNLFQTWQSNEGIIWSERGNKPFYFATFGKTSSSMESFRAYDTNAAQPDTSKITFINTLFYEDFESPEIAERSEAHAFSGKGALLTVSGTSEWGIEMPLDQVEGRDWLKISAMTYFEPDQKTSHRDQCAQFVIQLHDEDGRRRRYRSMNVAAYVGNDDGSIWSTGVPGKWDEAMFYFRMPRKLDGWVLKAYVLSSHGQEIFIDDVRIERYRSR